MTKWKNVIGILTALILGVNVSSAYAAESCPRCGAIIVGPFENHSCCDYLGHNTKSIQTKTTVCVKLWFIVRVVIRR